MKTTNVLGISILGQFAAYAVYSGFTLDSNAPGDTSNGIDIDLQGVSSLRIEDVQVRHQAGHGIDLRTGNMEMFTNVVVANNGGDGIHIESFTGAVRASANAATIRNVQATGNGANGVNLAAGDSHFISGLTTSNNQLYGLRLNGITSSVQVDSYSNVAGDILFDTSSIRNIVTLVHDTGMARVTNNGENNVILDMSTGNWHVPIWIFWPPINAKPFDPMRVTTAQRDALGDLKDGALVFNTQSGVLNLRRLAVWVAWPQAFEARLPLSRFYVTGTGTTDGGTTLDSREPSDGIGGGNNTPAVWWTWTAPCTFTSTGAMGFIDTSASDIGTIVGVFTGSSINALSLFASAQNPHGPVAGQSPVPISAGTTFQIRVRSAGSQNGVVRLRINGDAWPAPSPMRGRSRRARSRPCMSPNCAGGSTSSEPEWAWPHLRGRIRA